MNARLLFTKFYLYILRRRYRIQISGEEIMKTPGAKLILQNHQSHIDPQLLAVYTMQYCDFVPIVSANFFKIPVISSFLKAWNAVSVNSLKTGKRDPEVMKKIFQGVMDALKNNKSVIIAPSGTITHTPTEKIKNKQSAFVIVSDLPENTKVIGVRITGLWGSMWSVAWKGERPNFALTLLKGIFYVLANLIFLVPKRNIRFEFEDITEKAKEKAKTDRKTFNNFLEDFYNLHGPEKASYIKHFFFFPKSRRKYPENLSRD